MPIFKEYSFWGGTTISWIYLAGCTAAVSADRHCHADIRLISK